MASEKILSICIPTYNRATVLDRLLENLELEIKDVSERLEICVSDNGSNDDTIPGRFTVTYRIGIPCSPACRTRRLNGVGVSKGIRL